MNKKVISISADLFEFNIEANTEEEYQNKAKDLAEKLLNCEYDSNIKIIENIL